MNRKYGWCCLLLFAYLLSVIGVTFADDPGMENQVVEYEWPSNEETGVQRQVAEFEFLIPNIEVVTGTLTGPVGCVDVYEPVTASVVITNSGYFETGDFELRFESNGVTLSATTVDSINPTDSVTVSHTVQFVAAGSQTFKVIADPLELIAEDQEDDNEDSIVVDIGLPDFLVDHSKLAFNPDPAQFGQYVVVTGDTQNIGWTHQPDPVDMTLERVDPVDDSVLSTETLETPEGVSKDGTQQVTFGQITVDRSMYVRFTVDNSDDVCEGEETNNTVVSFIHVEAQDDLNYLLVPDNGDPFYGTPGDPLDPASFDKVPGFAPGSDQTFEGYVFFAFDENQAGSPNIIDAAGSTVTWEIKDDQSQVVSSGTGSIASDTGKIHVDYTVPEEAGTYTLEITVTNNDETYTLILTFVVGPVSLEAQIVEYEHPVNEQTGKVNQVVEFEIATDLPDLTVISSTFTVTPDNPDPGANIELNILAKNLGMVTAAGTSVSFFIADVTGDVLLGEAPVPSLGPDQEHVATFSVDLPIAGVKIFRAFIDYANTIDETNEFNNSASRFVQIGEVTFDGAIVIYPLEGNPFYLDPGETENPPITSDIPVFQPGELLEFSARAFYRITVTDEQSTQVDEQFDVEGADVEFYIVDMGNNIVANGVIGYTNVNGHFHWNHVLDHPPGYYQLVFKVTDHTFTGKLSLIFRIDGELSDGDWFRIFPPPPEGGAPGNPGVVTGDPGQPGGGGDDAPPGWSRGGAGGQGGSGAGGGGGGHSGPGGDGGDGGAGNPHFGGIPVGHGGPGGPGGIGTVGGDGGPGGPFSRSGSGGDGDFEDGEDPDNGPGYRPPDERDPNINFFRDLWMLSKGIRFYNVTDGAYMTIDGGQMSPKMDPTDDVKVEVTIWSGSIKSNHPFAFVPATLIQSYPTVGSVATPLVPDISSIPMNSTVTVTFDVSFGANGIYINESCIAPDENLGTNGLFKFYDLSNPGFVADATQLNNAATRALIVGELNNRLQVDLEFPASDVVLEAGRITPIRIYVADEAGTPITDASLLDSLTVNILPLSPSDGWSDSIELNNLSYDETLERFITTIQVPDNVHGTVMFHAMGQMVIEGEVLNGYDTETPVTIIDALAQTLVLAFETQDITIYTNKVSLDVSGIGEPNATINVTGGLYGSTQVTSDDNGLFTAWVWLNLNQLNLLYVSQTDVQGNISPSSLLRVYQETVSPDAPGAGMTMTIPVNSDIVNGDFEQPLSGETIPGWTPGSDDTGVVSRGDDFGGVSGETTTLDMANGKKAMKLAYTGGTPGSFSSTTAFVLQSTYVQWHQIMEADAPDQLYLNVLSSDDSLLGAMSVSTNDRVGFSSNWAVVVKDLSAYVGQTIKLEWEQQSDDGYILVDAVHYGDVFPTPVLEGQSTLVGPAGTVEDSAWVNVTWTNGSEVVSADQSGAFSITLDGVAAGERIEIYQIDKASNTSDTTLVEVPGLAPMVPFAARALTADLMGGDDNRHVAPLLSTGRPYLHRFTSLGASGSIELDMGQAVSLDSGNDLMVFEADTAEGYDVYGKAALEDSYALLGSGSGTTSFDVATSGIRYIKIVDDQSGTADGDTQPGADIMGVAALHNGDYLYNVALVTHGGTVTASSVWNTATVDYVIDGVTTSDGVGYPNNWRASAYVDHHQISLDLTFDGSYAINTIHLFQAVSDDARGWTQGTSDNVYIYAAEVELVRLTFSDNSVITCDVVRGHETYVKFPERTVTSVRIEPIKYHGYNVPDPLPAPIDYTDRPGWAIYEAKAYKDFVEPDADP